MPPRIEIEILAHEFEAFKALMPNEERLGANHEEWKQRTTAHAASSKRITVHPEEFNLYCVQIGQRPSYFVLEAFAVKKAGETP